MQTHKWNEHHVLCRTWVLEPFLGVDFRCFSYMSVRTTWQRLSRALFTLSVWGDYMSLFSPPSFLVLFVSVYVCVSLLLFARPMPWKQTYFLPQSSKSSVSLLCIAWLCAPCLCYVCEPLAHGTKIALLNPSGFNSCRHTLYHLSRGREAQNKVGSGGIARK